MSAVAESNPGLLSDFLIFSVSLAFCALTAFLETSITTLRLFQLKELAQTTGRYKQLFTVLEKHNHRVLTTILIAKNLADVAAATFGAEITAHLLQPLPDLLGVWLGIALVTTLILIFGEIVPKILAKTYGDRFFSYTLGLINAIYYALYPLVNLFMPLALKISKKLIGGKDFESSNGTSEKEIKFMIDYITEQGLMDQEKTSMLKNIFELGTTPVRTIMVPATSVVSLSATTNIREAFAIFMRYQYSRLPVYEQQVDNVIGMVYLKDIFPFIAHNQEKSLRDIIRPILFIPESTHVNQLLKEFKLKSMHIALVINEHGSIIGLVTLEDVLEEIVGEIHDEYESVSEKIITLKPGSWLIDASVELRSLGAQLNISFETQGAQTLSGFLNEQFQHLPKKGERLRYKHYSFQIQQAGTKRVLQVLAHKEVHTPPHENVVS